MTSFTWGYTCRCGCTNDNDTLDINLSYVTNSDGTYTLNCDASFICPGDEPITGSNKSCVVMDGMTNASITPTTYGGTSNMGASWIIGTLTEPTLFKVTINVAHFGTKSGYSVITLPKQPALITYYRSTISHTLKATTSKLSVYQWQESTTGGITWIDIEGATGPILTIGAWTGDEATSEEDALNYAYAGIPEYDKYFRCRAKTTGELSVISNILHVTHAGGAGDPIVSTSA